MLFTDARPGGHHLTLSEALQSEDADAQLEHPFALLTTPMVQTAAAILQAVVDRNGGLSMEDYRTILADGDCPALRRVIGWVQAEEAHPRYAMAGEHPFMQASECLFAHAEPESVEGLFAPIKRRDGSPSKGFRRPMRGQTLDQLCETCVRVGVWMNQSLQSAKGFYWCSADGAGGALVLTPRLDPGLRGIARTLIANIQVNGTRPTLPWYPGTKGSEALPTPLLGTWSADSPADIRTKLTRVMRLVPPGDEPGICHACNRQVRQVWNGFMLITEAAMMKQIPESLRNPLTESLKKAGQASTPLKSLYAPDARAPFVALRRRAADDPLRVYKPLLDEISVRASVPPWMMVPEVLSGMQCVLAEQVAQALKGSDARATMQLFCLHPASAQNDTITGLLDTRVPLVPAERQTQTRELLSEVHAAARTSAFVLAQAIGRSVYQLDDSPGNADVSISLPRTQLRAATNIANQSGIVDQYLRRLFPALSFVTDADAVKPGNRHNALRTQALATVCDLLATEWERQSDFYFNNDLADVVRRQNGAAIVYGWIKKHREQENLA